MPRETKFSRKICDIRYINYKEEDGVGLILVGTFIRDIGKGEFETRFSKIENTLVQKEFESWQRAIISFEDPALTISAKASIVGWFTQRNIKIHRKIENKTLVLMKNDISSN